MPTREDLQILQAQDLELKVMLTKQRIREWVTEFSTQGVYVSFSGGKDSTVLLHLVRSIYPDVEAVFVLAWNILRFSGLSRRSTMYGYCTRKRRSSKFYPKKVIL